MLRRMLRVNNWLDVAPPKNMEEDHSFLFLKWNLIKIFFFFLNLENLNFSKELKILDYFILFFEKNLEILNFFEGIENFDWWFFFSNLRSTSPMPLVPRPFLKISFFFFFWKIYKELIFFFFFFWNMKICSLSKSEEDEDKDGVKVMKIYSWWFFFLKNLSFEWE